MIGLGVTWAWLGQPPQLLTVLGGFVTIAGVGLASVRAGVPAWRSSRCACARPAAPERADHPPLHFLVQALGILLRLNRDCRHEHWNQHGKEKDDTISHLKASK